MKQIAQKKRGIDPLIVQTIVGGVVALLALAFLASMVLFPRASGALEGAQSTRRVVDQRIAETLRHQAELDAASAAVEESEPIGDDTTREHVDLALRRGSPPSPPEPLNTAPQSLAMPAQAAAAPKDDESDGYANDGPQTPSRSATLDTITSTNTAAANFDMPGFVTPQPMAAPRTPSSPSAEGAIDSDQSVLEPQTIRALTQAWEDSNRASALGGSTAGAIASVSPPGMVGAGRAFIVKNAPRDEVGAKKTEKRQNEALVDAKPGSFTEEALGESRRRAKAPELSELFEKRTVADAVSTFSLHVGRVSFQLAERSLLRNGLLPVAESVRPEEFTAAFDYGDPAPAAGEPVALAQEQCRHPALAGANLLRISLRTAAAGRAGGQPLNITVLLDKSGSMERPDRTAAARAVVAALGQKLTPMDRVTLHAFDRTARIVFENEPGDRAAGRILETLGTTGESGTNLESALEKTASIVGRRSQSGAVNRVLLITDGVANLGDVLPERLATIVAKLRFSGAALDVVAVGPDRIGDAVLTAMAREGDGRHFLAPDGRLETAETIAAQLAGAFRPAARNVKIQLRFNPERVARWSLIGFDQHRLREEDFRNDKVDAAEMAAAEQGSALYQIELQPKGSGEVGQIFVRFEETASRRMVERSWIIPWQPGVAEFGDSAPSMKLAGSATLLAEVLRGSALGTMLELGPLLSAASDAAGYYAGQSGAKSLPQMIMKSKSLLGRE